MSGREKGWEVAPPGARVEVARAVVAPPLVGRGAGTATRAYALVVAAAAIWGCFGVLAKTAYLWGVTPWTLVVYRAFLGFLTCALVALAFERSWLKVRRADLPFLALYALLGTSCFFAFLMNSISLNPVSVAVVLLYTAPAMAAVMGRLAFGEAMTPTKVVALIVSFVGCALVAEVQSAGSGVSLLGLAVGLGSGFTYALFSVLSRRLRQRYHPVTTQLYAFGLGGLFLTPALAMPEVSLGPYPWQAWLLLLVLGTVSTVLPRLLFVSALKQIEASRASIVATLEPVVATILAFLLLGEMASGGQMLGGLLVLGSAALIQRDSS